MELTTSRLVEAPVDVLWKLQTAPSEWPAHVPNFRRAEPVSDGPFGVGSTVRITQPGLGTVEWTVDEFADAGTSRSFAWSARAKGARFIGTHRVTAEGDSQSRLTLGLIATGGVMAVMRPLLRRTMQNAIDAEAECFQRWAADTMAAQVPGGSGHSQAEATERNER